MNATRFFMRLKHTLRETSANCVATVPAHLYGERQGVSSSSSFKRLERIFDAIFEVESFGGSRSGANEAYAQEYLGMVFVHRLFRVDTLNYATRISEAGLSSLGFKCRRKNFSIETVHLPPEMETVSRLGGGGGHAGHDHGQGEEGSATKGNKVKRHGHQGAAAHVHDSIDF